MTRVGLAVVVTSVALLAPGCTKGGDVTSANEPSSAPASSVTTITSAAEMRAAADQQVRLTGKVERAKLGDLISADGFSVYCTGARLGDGLVGQTVTVEGKLEVTDAFAATVGPNGEISQGTEPGSMTWHIQDCKVDPTQP